MTGALAGGGALALSGCRRRQFTLFNWEDYLAPAVAARFEEISGYRLEVYPFLSAAHMKEKLGIGATFDLCLTIDHFLPELVSAGLIERFPAVPSGVEHLDADFGPWVAPPELGGGIYGIPYLWGTTGICYDVDRVGEVNSWGALFDVRWKGRITVLDSRDDVFDQVLLAAGIRPEEVTADELREEVKPRLEAQKRLLRAWDSSPVDALVSGETWIAQCDGGDALRAAQERPSLRFVIPREGAPLWTDYMVMAATTPRPLDSLKFVELLLEPEWAAANANALMFGSPNLTAVDRGLIEHVDDPTVYPPAEVRARLFRHHEFTGETAIVAKRVWLEVRTT